MCLRTRNYEWLQISNLYVFYIKMVMIREFDTDLRHDKKLVARIEDSKRRNSANLTVKNIL